MIFIPLAASVLRQLRAAGPDGRTGSWLGFAATPEMMSAHGLRPADLEDAEYTALTYAGVQALLEPDTDQLRLVVAAEPPASYSSTASDSSTGSDSSTVSDRGSGADAETGAQQVSRLRWQDIQALFVDEPAAADAVRAARAAASGRSLTQALELPVVDDLINTHDLLWHLPQELDQIMESLAPGR
ncbi:hypothetical protein GCM10009841_28740 [Microlunatus panaciterrae]|uniref:Uncharacterized protein n=1 Tax=Microlunatus panaciterrae TaxID=400768 RepID=A0ABS2REU7_9ACTN|nr:hypothetical protein [Microlunatus panaciterrae]MBM7797534.1 hypothetical protein [Microlunatus panaciterrae]